jgi:hypothetical protein
VWEVERPRILTKSASQFIFCGNKYFFLFFFFATAPHRTAYGAVAVPSKVTTCPGRKIRYLDWGDARFEPGTTRFLSSALTKSRHISTSIQYCYLFLLLAEDQGEGRQLTPIRSDKHDSGRENVDLHIQ